MSNDTQPLMADKEQIAQALDDLSHHTDYDTPGYQVPGEASYQAYDKPVEPGKLLENVQLFSMNAVSDPLPGQEIRVAEATLHVHGPFTFLLNQNHNALRGCQACGAAWVGSMAGSEDNLRWHPVYEIEEEE